MNRITNSSEYCYLPEYGDRYRIYGNGRIVRNSYDITLPNGKTRHYKMKELKQRKIEYQDKLTKRLMPTDIDVVSIEGKYVVVGALVAYAWKDSFGRNLFRLPHVNFKHGDPSNISINTCGFYAEVLEDDNEDKIYYFLKFQFPDGRNLWRVSSGDVDEAIHKAIHNMKWHNFLNQKLHDAYHELGEPKIQKISHNNDYSFDEYRNLHRWCKIANTIEGNHFTTLDPDCKHTWGKKKWRKEILESYASINAIPDPRSLEM